VKAELIIKAWLLVITILKKYFTLYVLMICGLGKVWRLA